MFVEEEQAHVDEAKDSGMDGIGEVVNLPNKYKKDIEVGEGCHGVDDKKEDTMADSESSLHDSEIEKSNVTIRHPKKVELKKYVKTSHGKLVPLGKSRKYTLLKIYK